MITKPASATKKLGTAKQGTGAFPRPYADTADVADVLRRAIKPAAPGVVLVYVPDSTALPYARVAIERDIVQHHPVADVPMPAVTTLTALYSEQSRRDADFSKHLHRSGCPDQPGKGQEVVSLTSCVTLNCLSSEGAALLLDHVRDKTCVTAQQTIPDGAGEEVARVLATLAAGAKDHNGLIVLFLHGPSCNSIAWMQHHVEELLVVRECDPCPDASIAFSLQARSLGSQHAFGIGHTMYEVTIGDRWRQEQQVFIAADVRDRVMWLLRREGESLVDIACRLDVDKSTVSKRLKSLPLPPNTKVQVTMPKDWRKKWFEPLGIDALPRDETHGHLSSGPSTAGTGGINARRSREL
ncbi:winged helix-turn-helix domain-containing protein [Ralstonia sp. CHL-2022]|uniref:Winged helix-turn-helix domain-containing protein n=1 Tax=Ralstonia mojiangensis TaxID=2953895 RepID=A0ABT2LD17_9RALS|nr:winged helix-turn-helix domain-containing protein [Ralstonia mojiangensis]MCT7313291.1 winged helix-turn-helix domain-containing protein [Ralstonia mojiangensis]